MRQQDMAQLASELGFTLRFYATRENGERAYQVLTTRLRETPQGQALLLSFPADQLVDTSFADESIIRLGEELTTGKFGERGILLGGLTEDSIHNINAAVRLQGLKLGFLVVEPDGRWRVIGHLQQSLQQTLELVASRGHLTAPELAERLNLAVNTASNRLKRLYDQRLVRREYQITERGLEYTYFFWRWSVEGGA